MAWTYAPDVHEVYNGAGSICLVIAPGREDEVGRMIATLPDLIEALDPPNVRAAARMLMAAGHGLHAGVLILMADTQEAALTKAGFAPSQDRKVSNGK